MKAGYQNLLLCLKGCARSELRKQLHTSRRLHDNRWGRRALTSAFHSRRMAGVPNLRDAGRNQWQLKIGRPTIRHSGRSTPPTPSAPLAGRRSSSCAAIPYSLRKKKNLRVRQAQIWKFPKIGNPHSTLNSPKKIESFSKLLRLGSFSGQRFGAATSS